ncbi:MAG: hypothetical protein QXP34_00205 [Candidatus Aenigmatarchaeota archaeon]
MDDKINSDEHAKLYIEALNNLKTALPKFSLFLLLLVFLWIISPFIIELGKDIYLEIFNVKIETKNLINILLITYLTVLLLFTYREIILIGSAFSKLIVFYSSNPNDDISKLNIRIKKFENILSLLLVNIISFLIYYIFKDFLSQISQIFASALLLILTLSFLILLFLLSISLSSELELKIQEVFRTREKRKNGRNNNQNK